MRRNRLMLVALFLAPLTLGELFAEGEASGSPQPVSGENHATEQRTGYPHGDGQVTEVSGQSQPGKESRPEEGTVSQRSEEGEPSHPVQDHAAEPASGKQTKEGEAQTDSGKGQPREQPLLRGTTAKSEEHPGTVDHAPAPNEEEESPENGELAELSKAKIAQRDRSMMSKTAGSLEPLGRGTGTAGISPRLSAAVRMPVRSAASLGGVTVASTKSSTAGINGLGMKHRI